MCLAIPGKLIAIDGHRATVEYPGQTRQAMLGDPDFQIGDYVMVQMGIVSKKLTPEEADHVLTAWQETESKLAA